MNETCKWTIYENIGKARSSQHVASVYSDSLEDWRFCPICGNSIERHSQDNPEGNAK